MLRTRNWLSVKRQYLGGFVLLTLIAMICVAFSMSGNDTFDRARREIALRRIGHELLLQSGDSLSRVLPIKKIAENEYHISFEKTLTFQPDSLVHITRRLLANDPLANDYVVNVLNCGDSSVAYGYALSGNTKNDIISCLGRQQPRACYLISIKFLPAAVHRAKNGFLLGSLVLLTIIGYLLFRPVAPRNVLPRNGSATSEDDPDRFQKPFTSVFALGSMSFDAEARTFLINDQTIDLTKTEARVFRILALTPNEPVERGRLQKEIWEDEGIIVGRSLDMFISKLRKKLEPDPTVTIAVIRGKGYKLVISP